MTEQRLFYTVYLSLLDDWAALPSPIVSVLLKSLLYPCCIQSLKTEQICTGTGDRREGCINVFFWWNRVLRLRNESQFVNLRTSYEQPKFL